MQAPNRSVRCIVTDLSSTNGTWVNGVRLAPRHDKTLHAGDVVQLGVPEVAFELVAVDPQLIPGVDTPLTEAVTAVADAHLADPAIKETSTSSVLGAEEGSASSSTDSAQPAPSQVGAVALAQGAAGAPLSPTQQASAVDVAHALLHDPRRRAAAIYANSSEESSVSATPVPVSERVTIAERSGSPMLPELAYRGTMDVDEDTESRGLGLSSADMTDDDIMDGLHTGRGLSSSAALTVGRDCNNVECSLVERYGDVSAESPDAVYADVSDRVTQLTRCGHYDRAREVLTQELLGRPTNGVLWAQVGRLAAGCFCLVVGVKP